MVTSLGTVLPMRGWVHAMSSLLVSGGPGGIGAARGGNHRGSGRIIIIIIMITMTINSIITMTTIIIIITIIIITTTTTIIIATMIIIGVVERGSALVVGALRVGPGRIRQGRPWRLPRTKVGRGHHSKFLFKKKKKKR